MEGRKLKFNDLKIRPKILIGSACSLLIFIILSFVSYRSTQSLLENNAWVTHTYQVIQEAKNIEGAAVDMETGMRGYLLAGKEGFLDPYKAGKKRFGELVESLKKTAYVIQGMVRSVAALYNTKLLPVCPVSLSGW